MRILAPRRNATTRPRPHAAAFTLAASAVVLFSLAGCSSTPAAPASSPSPGPSTSPAPVATGTMPATMPATSTPVPTGSTPAATPVPTATAATTAAAGLCRAAMLTGSVDATGGGTAGSIYMQLIVKNTSTASCVLNGYPGVSMVGSSSGSPIGEPATRDSSRPSTGAITLKPGASASAVLRYTQAGNYPSCMHSPAPRLRVYPPSATDSLYIAHPLTACTNTNIALLTIGAFQK